MQTQRRLDYPNIVAHLVFPFERPYFQGKCRIPALGFARGGSLVLFAVEYQRQFGVGFLDHTNAVVEPRHFATYDKAVSAFVELAGVPA
jgi:hypothetical protein